MKKINVERIKSKAKTYAPAVVSGIAIGATVVAVVSHRKYHPKDKVAIQFPNGVLEKMRDEGKTLAIDSNAGWFTLKYHPTTE